MLSPYLLYLQAGNYLTVPDARGLRRSNSDVFSTSHMHDKSMDTLVNLEPSSPLSSPSRPRSPSSFHKSPSVGSELSRHGRPISRENSRQFARGGSVSDNQNIPRTISEEPLSLSPTSRIHGQQNGQLNATDKIYRDAPKAARLHSANSAGSGQMAVPGGGSTHQRDHERSACGQYRWCQYCGLLVFLAVLGLVGYGVYEGSEFLDSALIIW